MPLPVAHTLFGASLLTANHPQTPRQKYFPLAFAAFLSIAPDFDFALVILTGDLDWHRGFTHSIAFALTVFLLLLMYFGKQRLREAVAYGLAFASHAFLDFITTKHGGGLELLFPFSDERFRSGWFGLSEMTGQITAFGVLYALVLEFLIFSPLLMFFIWRRRQSAISEMR